MYYAVFYVKCNVGGNKNVYIYLSNKYLKQIKCIVNVYKDIRNTRIKNYKIVYIQNIMKIQMHVVIQQGQVKFINKNKIKN